MKSTVTRHDGQVNNITFSMIDKMSFNIKFRLRGEHLLSLHDESRQRRAKEREDNRSERFSSLSLESFPIFRPIAVRLRA